MTRLVLLSTLAVLSACGGNESVGTGNNALFVWARFSTDGSTTSSNARVQVREGGAFGPLVKDATVTVAGTKLPKATIPFIEMSNEYRLDGFGWDETIMLEVSRGSTGDKLEASVKPPGTSAITAPTTDSTNPISGGLKITWRDAGGAKANTVRVRMEQAQIDVTLPEDNGEYTVSQDKLIATDRESIYLERTNDVSLGGGTPGSVMSVTTYHSVRFRME